MDPTQSEKSLWNRSAAVKTAGDTDFEQTSSEASGLTITRRTEWQARPVEDSKLTYSASGSGVKLTLREASSAGFSRTDLAHGIGPNTDADIRTMPGTRGETSLARSQRVDWTLVNLKNFGLTAFGYQNEVGTDFQQFGQTKTEFGAAGTSTMKVGSEVRIGAFGFGLAQSSIANADGYAGAYLTSAKTNSTVQQHGFS